MGVDEQSADEYGENLKENLERLEGMFKTGRYKAPPVKRVYIPKDGKDELRPLGIPTVRGQGIAEGGEMGDGTDIRAGLL